MSQSDQDISQQSGNGRSATKGGDPPGDPRIDTPPPTGAVDELRIFCQRIFGKLAADVQEIRKQADQLEKKARRLKDNAEEIVSEIDRSRDEVHNLLEGWGSDPGQGPSSGELAEPQVYRDGTLNP